MPSNPVRAHGAFRILLGGRDIWRGDPGVGAQVKQPQPTGRASGVTGEARPAELATRAENECLRGKTYFYNKYKFFGAKICQVLCIVGLDNFKAFSSSQIDSIVSSLPPPPYIHKYEISLYHKQTM